MKQDWLDAFKVDGASGPAAPIDAQETDALAAKAVERALSMPGGGAPTRLHQTWMGLTVVGISGAILALGAIAVSRTDKPAPASPAAITTAASVATAEPLPTTVSPPIETVAVTSLPNAVSAPAAPAIVAPAAAKVVETKTASDLLAEANDARRQSKWADAAGLYERVMHSQADESYAATVALASLRLEHFGDPRGALALYEKALSARPGGSLTAQAEAGAERCRSALQGPASAP